MEENVFNFKDFLKDNNVNPSEKKDIKKLFEEVVEELESENEVHPEEERPLLGGPESSHKVHDNYMRKLIEDEEDENDDTEEEYEDEEIQESKSEDEFYKVYKDINEEFSCDIEIEGADKSKTEARLVLESEDWNIMFTGQIKNGKCIIPMKKLNIFNENQVGNIRLEVIAEGNLFIPWEDKFKVKLSKKVTVKVNEKKEVESRKPKGTSVKVKVKK